MSTGLTRVLVTGGGGFIGSHLVAYLKQLGYWVRAVDLREPPFMPSQADEYAILDLREARDCRDAMRGVDQVYALAADMGGIGYISCNHATILHDNALINLNTIDAAQRAGVDRYLFASSACVYPEWRQATGDARPLQETDAFPADPPTAYGWEKLTGERLVAAYGAEHGMTTRIPRLHNVYGPHGTYEGGREKVPAALCRKVARAAPGEAIKVWGDGTQRRSFLFIDDCVRGLHQVMTSGYAEPLNVGSDSAISIHDLAQMVIDISGKQDLTIKHVAGPQGVYNRNSDNTWVRRIVGWAPAISLSDGLRVTYRWVAAQIEQRTWSPQAAGLEQPTAST